MRGHDLFRAATLAATLLCYTTILLGGNVMASDNGLACPHWPTCYGNGNLFPVLRGGVALEWGHRLSAFFLATSVLIVAVLALAFERARRAFLALSAVALALVVAEALLGGLVVDSALLIPLVLVHLAVATALFAILVLLSLLANWRELPPRWVRWAQRAVAERPDPSDPVAPEPVPVGAGVSLPGE